MQQTQKQQTVFRIQKHEQNYLILDKTAVCDPRLSYKAVGLHTWMMSKPNDWRFNLPDMINSHKDGEDSIRTAIKELEACGYVKRFRPRNERGQLGPTEMLVYEVPQHGNPHVGIPHEGNPRVGNRDVGTGEKTTPNQGFHPQQGNPHVGNPHVVNPNGEKPHGGNPALLSIYSLPSTESTNPTTTTTRVNEIWIESQKRLEVKISKPSFDTWLKHTMAVGYEPNCLIIACQSEFQIDWITSRYSDLIKETLVTVTGCPDVHCKFVQRPEVFGSQAGGGAHAKTG